MARTRHSHAAESAATMGLEDLPAEILVSLVYLLPLPGVVALAGTCRAIRRAVDTTPVWESLSEKIPQLWEDAEVAACLWMTVYCREQQMSMVRTHSLLPNFFSNFSHHVTVSPVWCLANIRNGTQSCEPKPGQVQGGGLGALGHSSFPRGTRFSPVQSKLQRR